MARKNRVSVYDGIYHVTSRIANRAMLLAEDEVKDRIMENLRQRVDPKTGLVRPRWKQMARELGVSRSTIARQMAELYANGAYERIYVKASARVTICYYRLKD